MFFYCLGYNRDSHPCPQFAAHVFPTFILQNVVNAYFSIQAIAFFILAIRLLLAYSLGTDLSGVPDPQLKLQLTEQSFKPAPMPAGFHPDPHLLTRQCTVERFRLLPMP